MKRDVIFDLGKSGKIKAQIFVKQHSLTNFAAMVTFEYPEDIEPRLKKLLDCAQCPHMGSTMQEAMSRAYESTKTLLKRPLNSLEEFRP